MAVADRSLICAAVRRRLGVDGRAITLLLLSVGVGAAGDERAGGRPGLRCSLFGASLP
jgi:hypothetical protein